MNLKEISAKIAQSKIFELGITLVIIVNSVLIGVQTTVHNPVVENIQHLILWIFSFEIAIRFIAAKDVKSFFSDGWNVFDFH